MLKKVLISVSLIFSAAVTYADETTWPDGQFESKYETVHGSKIHYVEHGEGDPILLVHGIPTSAYLWRNMIEPLSQNGRVIAVDMIGYGNSDKPNLQYKLTELQNYLEAFIVQLDLENIQLVVHDLGGPVALPVASKNPERFKAIVAFETILGPIEHRDDLNDFQKSINDQHGIRGPGGQGYDLIVRQNVFVPMITQAALDTNANPAEYIEPFADPLSRFAIYRPFQDIPVEGRPRRTHRILSKSNWTINASK